MEDYLVLQICRVRLQEALDSGSKDEMVGALKYSSKMLPYGVALNGVDEARVIMYGNNLRYARVPFECLDELSVRWNVEGFIAAIDKEFTYVQYKLYRVPFERSEEVFEKGVVWRSDDVLYRQGTGVLDVEGLLKVCGYAVMVGESFGPDNVLYDEALAAVRVFKGLEMVLENKWGGGAVPKMFYLVNDFLVRVVKPSLEKAENKQVAVGLGVLVDLAIGFFSGR